MFDPNSRYNPTYYTNSNPNGNFQENTYTKKYNNFNQAFEIPTTLIEHTNFRNQGNVIHNNLEHNLNKEIIKEYTIDIDSLDRNINLYPDPFKFSTCFSNNSSIVSNNHYQDNPMINRSFINIKYIRVNNAILPKIYDVKYSDELKEYIYDNTKDIYLDRFVVLKIDELTDNNVYSTNSLVDRKGIKLYQKYSDSLYFFRAEPLDQYSNTYFYKDSYLGNINKLKISFYDGIYNEIKFSNLDVTSTDVNEIRNPLFKNFQVNINLTVGIVENELSTNRSYRPS